MLETIIPIPGRFIEFGFPHLKKHPEASYRLKHKCSNEGYCTMCIESFCIGHYNDLQNSLFSCDCLERLQKTSKVSAKMIRHSPCLTISFYSILKPKSLDGDHQMEFPHDWIRAPSSPRGVLKEALPSARRNTPLFPCGLMRLYRKCGCKSMAGVVYTYITLNMVIVRYCTACMYMYVYHCVSTYQFPHPINTN